MKTSGACALTKGDCESHSASPVRAAPMPLDFDRIIANLSATLIGAGAERIEATMPDRPANSSFMKRRWVRPSRRWARQ